MVHFSNVLIAILNILTMLIVVASLAIGIYFHFLDETHCQKFLQTPLLVLGAFLFMVSLCELVGSTCKVSFLLWIYLFVIFLWLWGSCASPYSCSWSPTRAWVKWYRTEGIKSTNLRITLTSSRIIWRMTRIGVGSRVVWWILTFAVVSRKR